MKRGSKHIITVVLVGLLLILLLVSFTDVFGDFNSFDEDVEEKVEGGCSDSDVSGVYVNGENAFVKGSVKGVDVVTSEVTTVEDLCISDERVMEYYCQEDGSFFNKPLDCANGCVDGACVELCSDSDVGGVYVDGQNAFVKGSVTGIDVVSSEETSVEDICISDSKVMEYYCLESGAFFNKPITCENGCVDGACVNLCSDSDVSGAYPNGQNPSMKGSVTGINIVSSEETSVEDSCISDERVMEYYCLESGAFFNKPFDCVNGCVDGACDDTMDIIAKTTVTHEGADIVFYKILCKIGHLSNTEKYEECVLGMIK